MADRRKLDAEIPLVAKREPKALESLSSPQAPGAPVEAGSDFPEGGSPSPGSDVKDYMAERVASLEVQVRALVDYLRELPTKGHRLEELV